MEMSDPWVQVGWGRYKVSCDPGTRQTGKVLTCGVRRVGQGLTQHVERMGWSLGGERWTREILGYRVLGQRRSLRADCRKLEQLQQDYWGSGVPLRPSRTPLTWHMDHAAVAALHHGLLLTLEAAGSDAVGVIARQQLLPLHAGPAVPPRLWQVGKLLG